MDSLRDRIVTALWESWQPTEPSIESMADAVIAELGLQTHLAKRIINGKPDQWVRRHVTDWEIVNE